MYIVWYILSELLYPIYICCDNDFVHRMNGESGIFVADRGSENKRYGREKGTLLKSRHAKVYLNSSYFRIRFFPIENIR